MIVSAYSFTFPLLGILWPFAFWESTLIDEKSYTYYLPGIKEQEHTVGKDSIS